MKRWLNIAAAVLLVLVVAATVAGFIGFNWLAHTLALTD